MLLNNDWADQLVATWNESTFRESLAGLGVVRFVVLNSPDEGFCIRWDSGGYAILATNQAEEFTFSATRDDWLAFFDGRFTAAQGVADELIRFEGELKNVLRYAASFNNVAVMARALMNGPASRYNCECN